MENDPVSFQDKDNRIKNEYDLRSYIKVGTFSALGTAAGKVPAHIGPAAELRIRVVEHKNENWVALSEVMLVS